MKNITMIAIIGIIILLGLFIFINSNNNQVDINGSVIENGNSENSNDVQKITLGIKNYNYYPNTIEVEEGKQVEITLDQSVKGCLRDFTISELGVRKYSKNVDDKIIFTPNKKGTFGFACSMGMGTGTIVVK